METFNPYEKADKKKLAILGTAPTVANAPFDNAEFDIWGVAHCCFLAEVKRLDAIFEIHKKEIWIKDNAPFHRFPNADIWLLEKDEKFSKSKSYPVQEMLDKYAVNKGFQGEQPYMSSSLPYMVILALEKGYEEIHFYGIHLAMDEEYFYQRPCLERYIGIAEGKGVRVYVDPGADIMKFGYVYGLQEKESDQRVAEWKVRLDEFDKRINATKANLDNGIQNLSRQLYQLTGAREEVVNNLRKYGKEVKSEYIKF